MSALPFGGCGVPHDLSNPTMTDADFPDAFPEEEPAGIRAWCLMLRNMQPAPPEDAAARAAVEGIGFRRPATARPGH